MRLCPSTHVLALLITEKYRKRLNFTDQFIRKWLTKVVRFYEHLRRQRLVCPRESVKIIFDF